MRRAACSLGKGVPNWAKPTSGRRGERAGRFRLGHEKEKKEIEVYVLLSWICRRLMIGLNGVSLKKL